MPLLRISRVEPMKGFRLRLTLTNGAVVERDLAHLLVGPVFEALREDAAAFRRVRVEAGTLAWENGADLCPDVLIWGGLPRDDEDAMVPAEL